MDIEVRELEILKALYETYTLGACYAENFVGSEAEYFMLLAYGETVDVNS